MVFMGPVDAPVALDGQEKIVIESDVFGELGVEVKYL